MHNEPDILRILSAIAHNNLTPEAALAELRYHPSIQTMEGMNLDVHRKMRTGFGETVFAPGKSDQHLCQAVGLLSEDGAPVLVSRVSPAQAAVLSGAFPTGEWSEQARLFSVNAALGIVPPWPKEGSVVIVTAGSADMPVALEAFGTLRFHGCSPALAPDIGVAGLHRIKPWLPVLDAAAIIIVVAGMEGALPSVIAGLVKAPVLAVPTSVGYGVSLGGFAALAGMLSSCSPGISVCNIDNGYGAAMFAARLVRQAANGSQ